MATTNNMEARARIEAAVRSEAGHPFASARAAALRCTVERDASEWRTPSQSQIAAIQAALTEYEALRPAGGFRDEGSQNVAHSAAVGESDAYSDDYYIDEAILVYGAARDLAELRATSATDPHTFQLAAQVYRSLARDLPEMYRHDAYRILARGRELEPWRGLGLLAADAEHKSQFIAGLSAGLRALLADLAELAEAAGRAQTIAPGRAPAVAGGGR